MAATESDSDPQPSAPQPAPPAEPGDDVRRRFREALERKRQGAAGGQAGHPNAQAHAPTSNDKRQRNFRRKSGG
jgi:hypothetical protein